ncbi:MAG: XdhC family protein [Cyclobacteriaceae bacterium]|nr:XdhC family protein [Cyclobacteriaceae bacterium]
MFNKELLQNISIGQEENEPAAIAIIVRREGQTSGKPGDKALITSKGEVKGWIGGGCTRGIVIKEALASIKEGTPRLVKIQPTEDTPKQNGVSNYKMTCMSGGSVDVYIEPIMPVSQIKIFGRSHIAKALCQIGKASGFGITVVSDRAEEDMFPQADKIISLKEFDNKLSSGNDFVVVCTQGENDGNSLLEAIKIKSNYIAFVASRKKANAVFLGLKKEGIPLEQLAHIKTPAGLDINAKTPEEVAISILGQIIQIKRSGEPNSSSIPSLELEENDDLYINPVCKIPVSKSGAKHILEHKGEKVYFCCDGCKESFEKEPELYIQS